MRRVLVPVLITISVASAAAADRTRPAVPLRIDDRGAVLVPVRVNGAGPFTFVLDTGAARSIVSDTLARELAAPVVARSEVVTSAGSEMTRVVRLSSVAVAASSVSDLLAPVVEDSRLSQLGRGIRGLLGQDFLAAFNYTLDYRRARLVWEEPVACDARDAIPAVVSEGRPVISVSDDRGERLRLVPDSGAEIAVLFHARGDARGGRVRLASLTAGTQTAETIAIPLLRMGAASLRQVNAVIVERHDPAADGLLPLHVFSSVTFAAGGACVVPR